MSYFLRSIFLTIFLANICQAYQFTTDFKDGFYWKNFPISYDIVGANQNEANLLYDLAARAKSEWERVAANNIWDFSKGFTTGRSREINSIRWSNNFAAETGFDPNVTLAVTTRYTQGTFVSKSEIILNGNSSQMRNNPDLLYRTLLHEMGHTVGLDHTNLNAVMYPYITNHTSPQSDDIDGINALINETLNRQGTGYISPLSQDDFNQQIATCGTLNLGSDNNQNGPTNFIFSIMLGFMLIFLMKLLSTKLLWENISIKNIYIIE